MQNVDIPMSLPAWECGLKLNCVANLLQATRSLPAWECGLKLDLPKKMAEENRCHSLRGSVD